MPYDPAWWRVSTEINADHLPPPTTEEEDTPSSGLNMSSGPEAVSQAAKSEGSSPMTVTAAFEAAKTKEELFRNLMATGKLPLSVYLRWQREHGADSTR
jgi:hypothetical protein